MANIFEIEQELNAIYAEFEANGGEFTEEMELALAVSEEELSSKLDGYAYVIAKSKANIEFFKDQKSMFDSKMKVEENKQERLKNIMLQCVNRFGTIAKSGTKAYKTDRHNFTAVSKDSLFFDNEERFDDVDYLKYSIDLGKVDSKTKESILEPLKRVEGLIPTIKTSIDKRQLLTDLKELEVLNKFANSGAELPESTQERLNYLSQITNASVQTKQHILIK